MVKFHSLYRNQTKRSHTCLRVLCALLCAVLLSAFCTGCVIPYAAIEDVDLLKAELADAAAEIESLKQKQAAAEQELEALKQARQDSERELGELETACNETKKELEALETRHESALQEIEKLKQENEDREQELNGLKAEADAAALALAELRESCRVAEQEISVLMAALSSLKSAQELAEREISALQTWSEEMQREIEALQASKNEAERELEALRERYRQAEQEIEGLWARIEALEDGMGMERIRLYIDQGHNPTSYHNAGAVGNGLCEQDLTFAIGQLLADLLKADGRFEICLSRPTADTVLGTDSDSSLDARVQGAEDFEADYFISLHINSFDNAGANGIEVYAAEQGSVSYGFGEALLQGMVDATGLYDRGMKLNPELRVLKNTTMPAVLLEMGFISNAEDAALLADHPERFAQGIYNGLLTYFALAPNNG